MILKPALQYIQEQKPCILSKRLGVTYQCIYNYASRKKDIPYYMQLAIERLQIQDTMKF